MNRSIPAFTKHLDPLGDLIVAADKPCRSAAIAANARRLRHGLCHHRTRIGVGFLGRADRRIQLSEIEQSLQGCFSLGLYVQ